MKYPGVTSALRPVPHSKELPVPKPPEILIFNGDNSVSDKYHEQQEGDSVDCNLTFEASFSSSEPHLLRQRNLNDVCDLNLSKKQAELLGSRLKG